MRGSLRPSVSVSKGNGEPNFLTPDLRHLCAVASKRATEKNVKAIAALVKVPPKRLYAVNEEDAPGACEMLARKIAASLLIGTPRADALAELHLLVSLFQEIPEPVQDINKTVAELAREAGEAIATAVDRLADGVASEEDAAAVERECHQLIDKAQETMRAVRARVKKPTPFRR